jgi:hypothetical protein
MNLMRLIDEYILKGLVICFGYDESRSWVSLSLESPLGEFEEREYYERVSDLEDIFAKLLDSIKHQMRMLSEIDLNDRQEAIQLKRVDAALSKGIKLELVDE